MSSFWFDEATAAPATAAPAALLPLVVVVVALVVGAAGAGAVVTDVETVTETDVVVVLTVSVLTVVGAVVTVGTAVTVGGVVTVGGSAVVVAGRVGFDTVAPERVLVGTDLVPDSVPPAVWPPPPQPATAKPSAASTAQVEPRSHRRSIRPGSNHEAAPTGSSKRDDLTVSGVRRRRQATRYAQGSLLPGIGAEPMRATI